MLHALAVYIWFRDNEHLPEKFSIQFNLYDSSLHDPVKMILLKKEKNKRLYRNKRALPFCFQKASFDVRVDNGVLKGFFGISYESDLVYTEVSDFFPEHSPLDRNQVLSIRSFAFVGNDYSTVLESALEVQLSEKIDDI